MKQITFIVCSLVLVVLLTLTAAPCWATDVVAQPSEATASTTSSFIKYDLAFPGILPDHPLFKLKVARDKIINFLIRDPYKKIDFYLREADKGILATAILVDKNKLDLAGQTALKAEHNVTLLTTQLLRLPNKPDDALFQRLTTASLKHQEVLESLIKRVPQDKQSSFKSVLEFSKTNLLTIERLKKRDPKRWNKPDY